MTDGTLHSAKAFQKFDESKNRLELIDPNFILGIGKILTFGANKYAPNNWKLATTEDIERIKGSVLRHLMAYLNDEFLDPESNLPHLHHAACNLMFLSYFADKTPKGTKC